MSTQRTNRNLLPRLTVVSLLAVLTAASTSSADWGTLKGRFVYDGPPVDPAALNVNKDVQYCSQHNPVDETIVVADDGGLANVFVYIYTRRGQSIEVHPDLAVPEEPAVLDNRGCRFEPHAMVVRVGQPLEVHNSDTGLGHNTNITFLNNPPFNQIVPNDKPLVLTPSSSEVRPSPVTCNIHPWMNANILVREDPYCTVSAADGTFEILNIPAGEHTFNFWHESPSNIRNLQVGSEKTDRRGRVDLEIPASGELDLGDVEVTPDALGL